MAVGWDNCVTIQRRNHQVALHDITAKSAFAGSGKHRAAEHLLLSDAAANYAFSLKLLGATGT